MFFVNGGYPQFLVDGFDAIEFFLFDVFFGGDGLFEFFDVVV